MASARARVVSVAISWPESANIARNHHGRRVSGEEGDLPPKRTGLLASSGYYARMQRTRVGGRFLGQTRPNSPITSWYSIKRRPKTPFWGSEPGFPLVKITWRPGPKTPILQPGWRTKPRNAYPDSLGPMGNGFLPWTIPINGKGAFLRGGPPIGGSIHGPHSDWGGPGGSRGGPKGGSRGGPGGVQKGVQGGSRGGPGGPKRGSRGGPGGSGGVKRGVQGGPGAQLGVRGGPKGGSGGVQKGGPGGSGGYPWAT